MAQEKDSSVARFLQIESASPFHLSGQGLVFGDMVFIEFGSLEREEKLRRALPSEFSEGKQSKSQASEMSIIVALFSQYLDTRRMKTHLDKYKKSHVQNLPPP